MTWEPIALTAGAGVLLALLVGGPLWVGDAAQDEEDRKRLAASLAGRGDVRTLTTAEAPAAFTRAFDRLFGVSPGRLGFIFKAMLLSLLTGAVLLATFLVVNPVFLTSVLSDSYQRGAVFGQFLKVIIVVNLAVDYICLVYCRDVVGRLARDWSGRALAWTLAKDFGVKALVMLVAMVFVFSGAAGQNGPVGRQQWAVFQSLPHVLLDGATFGNLSAIYIWSGFISSLWLWGWLVLTPRLARIGLSGGRRPMRTVALALGGGAAVLYWLAVGIAAVL